MSPIKNAVSFINSLSGVILCFVILFSSTLCGMADSNQIAILSFEQFYHRVLSYYPELKRQNALIEIALAKKLYAEAGFLPAIRAGASLMNGNDPVFVFSSLLHEQSFKESNFEISSLNKPASRTTSTLSLNAEVPIFNAFQTILAVKSATAIYDATKYEEMFAKKEVLLICVESYLKALVATKLFEVAEQICKEAQIDIKQAEEFSKKGLILGADFYAAKVIFSNLEKYKNEIASQKQMAYEVMNVLMGESVQKQFSLSVAIPDKYEFKEKDLNDLLENAYQNRPDYIAMKNYVEASKINFKREKASNLPKISAFGEARRDSSDFIGDGGESYVLGIKMSLDIFDASYSPRKRLARQLLADNEFRMASLKDKITRDLVAEYNFFSASKTNLMLLDTMCKDSQQTIQLMLPLYREGRKSIVDLMESRANCFKIHHDYYSLIGEVIASEFRLLFLTGRLDESFISKQGVFYGRTTQ